MNIWNSGLLIFPERLSLRDQKLKVKKGRQTEKGYQVLGQTRGQCPWSFAGFIEKQGANFWAYEWENLYIGPQKMKEFWWWYNWAHPFPTFSGLIPDAHVQEHLWIQTLLFKRKTSKRIFSNFLIGQIFKNLIN